MEIGGILMNNHVSSSASKAVSMTELFYDLVFAYSISNVTGLLEISASFHFSWISVAAYLISFVVLVNTWMYQAVFTNRYGDNSFSDRLLTYIQMGVLLFVSASLTEPLTEVFQPLCLALGLLSLLLFIQYFAAWWKMKNPDDRSVIRSFMIMIGLRTLFFLSALLFDERIGIFIAVIGVIVGWLLPPFFRKPMQKRPVHFSHLSERLSLITILMFGEMIISLAYGFHPETFSLRSVLGFALCAVLYRWYSLFYEKYREDTSFSATGISMIYLHYPILLGLDLTTAAIRFLDVETVPVHLCAVLMSIGLFLFLAGSYGTLFVQRKCLKCTFAEIAWTILLIAPIGWVAFQSENPDAVLGLNLVCIVIQLLIVSHFFIRTASSEKTGE